MLGLAFSLKQFIEKETTIHTVIKYDGIKLPEQKPFVLVEYRPTTNQELSKGRETIHVIYRFQIGVFAESSYKLSEYHERLSDLFLFNNIMYYDEEVTMTDYSFNVNPDFNITTIYSDDITKETTKHRFYIDVEINVNKHKNN